MRKIGVKEKGYTLFLKKKTLAAMFSTILAVVLIAGYFLGTAFGASEEVLNGDGAMDNSIQVGAWTLQNITGVSSWESDSANHYAGAGSGKLSSPTGANVPFDSYAYYRFTTSKVPVSATLDLACKKQYTNAQPLMGNWNVAAEIWEAGGTAPLQTIELDNGTSNIDFTKIESPNLTAVNKPDTQYELRLVQKGVTGNDPSAQLVAWFDEVKVNVNYDSTPPQLISAVSTTDHSVDVVFGEPVNRVSAETTANYSISPLINVTGAVLQPDDKTVELATDTQVRGTVYQLTVDKVQDISLNAMTSPGAVSFTGVDTTPPTVVSAVADKDNKVSIKFSEPVDSATAQNTLNYTISPVLQVFDAILQPDGQTVQLTTATQGLNANYTVTTSGIDDLAGNVITGSNTAGFTGVDTTPPEIAWAVPIDDSTLNVTFNEEVDRVQAQKAGNYDISPALNVTSAILQGDNKTVQLKTSRQLWQVNYTVKANNVSDLSGNVIAGNNVAAFTGMDTTCPTVLSVKAVDDRNVDVLFSEVVDAGTAQIAGNYSISPGLTVNNAVVQSDGKTVRLTTEVQTNQISYTVTVTGVQDLAGNTINGNNKGTFSGCDTTSPIVVSAAAVNYNTVSLVFNEKVDSTSAQTTSNYIISPALPVKKAVLQSDGMTVKLTTDVQTGGTAYTVKVTGVKDQTGNTIAGSNTADFAGISPPVVTSPQPLTAKAVDNASVVVVFSANMDPVTARNPANYSMSPLLAVTGAVLQKDGVTVRLSTGLQTSGTIYKITVTNVQDQYGNVTGSFNNTVVFPGSETVSSDPHGKYLNDTNQCANCHQTHNGQGAGLINEPNQTQLCYLCHDAGGQSKYDVADQFGITAPFAASHHKIPEGTQQCTDCHNPHDGGQDAGGNSIHWTRLLQSSADSTSHGGNQFCFSCHQNDQGSTKPINPMTYPAEGTGHNTASFVINGVTPFNPLSGTGISCAGCHEQHGSSQVKLLRDKLNDNSAGINGDDKSQCYNCHSGASSGGRFLGQSVYDNTNSNPHSLTSSSKTNTSYPGVTGQAGQCVNCHDPHGSNYGTSRAKMKTLRAPYNDGKTLYTAADFTFCFGCHNNTSPNSLYDIQTPYNTSAGGHYIKTAGGNLDPGSKMPCEACHNLHGSANNNKYMLKDSLGSNLGDGRNECLTCHQNGKSVEGINMSPPPSDVVEHSGTSVPCLTCHGAAHNPQ